jgi:hypothetical protein
MRNLLLVATAASAAATAIAHGGRHLVVISALTSTSWGREDGEQAVDFFAATLHADNIVSVLVADQHFKFRFAIWAVVLVQWHGTLPPMDKKHFVIISIVLFVSANVKRF